MLASFVPAAVNLLILLGGAFLLSGSFDYLRSLSRLKAKLVLGAGFAALAVGSMLMAFPIAPGVFGDYRNAIVAVAALVGGPVAAIIAAAASCAVRISLGGHWATACAGIAIGAVLSIGFALSSVPKTPRFLALFGLGLAAANALLPVLSGALPVGAWRVALIILLYAGVTYPLGIALIGGLLQREQRRAEEKVALKQLNHALTMEQARTESVFDRAAVAMSWIDLRTGRFIRINPQYSKFTGFTEAELVGKTFDVLSAPGDSRGQLDFLAPLRRGEHETLVDEREYLRRDGTLAWGLRAITAVHEGGEPRYAFTVIQDITEQQEARARILHLATHDPLTGLANRGRLQEEFDRAATGSAGLVLFCVDLDNFKEINDTFGHATGDLILRRVAARLNVAAGADGFAARYGGDEFAILTQAPPDLEHFAASLMEQVKEPIVLGPDTVSPAISMGAAVFPRDGRSLDDLMRKADLALYEAKAAGRGHLKIFEPELERRILDRQKLKAELVEAVGKNQLEVVFQPIVDVASRNIVGCEALLRWNHPVRGLILPSVFIPLAEESGAIVSIGQWTLREACRIAATWPKTMRLAVNLSSRELSPSLPLHVAKCLAMAGFPPHRLELEITETVQLTDDEQSLGCLHALSQLGISFALDDFGTGYASLSYLQRFPFQKLKIDRSFVSSANAEAHAVVRALVGLGHSLNMTITAEGVETEEQLAQILAEGCDQAQGYLFSKPLSAADTAVLLATGRPIAQRRAG